jgi:hypothetical protein
MSDSQDHNSDFIRFLSGLKRLMEKHNISCIGGSMSPNSDANCIDDEHFYIEHQNSQVIRTYNHSQHLHFSDIKELLDDLPRR